MRVVRTEVTDLGYNGSPATTAWSGVDGRTGGH
jgi:hypothetical protein